MEEERLDEPNARCTALRSSFPLLRGEDPSTRPIIVWPMVEWQLVVKSCPVEQPFGNNRVSFARTSLMNPSNLILSFRDGEGVLRNCLLR